VFARSPKSNWPLKSRSPNITWEIFSIYTYFYILQIFYLCCQSCAKDRRSSHALSAQSSVHLTLDHDRGKICFADAKHTNEHKNSYRRFSTSWWNFSWFWTFDVPNRHTEQTERLVAHLSLERRCASLNFASCSMWKFAMKTTKLICLYDGRPRTIDCYLAIESVRGCMFG
jgi:hypothetical protein